MRYRRYYVRQALNVVLCTVSAVLCAWANDPRLTTILWSLVLFVNLEWVLVIAQQAHQRRAGRVTMRRIYFRGKHNGDAPMPRFTCDPPETCPNCRGWLTRKTLNESLARYHCSACGWDYLKHLGATVRMGG